MIKFSVVVIKPLSIRRGDGHLIISDILDKSNLTLRKLRGWDICDSTWRAIEDISKDTPSEFKIPGEKLWVGSAREAWSCLFTHKENEDPYSTLMTLMGPDDMSLWASHHLRYKYSAFKTQQNTCHPGDNVFYLSPPDKEELIAKLLFNNFDVEDI